VVHASAPQWDLPLVLEALVTEPFEPLELSSLKALSWKTALLLALTSARRVSELAALSVHPSCLLSRGDRSGATLRPNPSFVPKSRRSSFRSRVIRVGQQVSDHPLDIVHLCFPVLLRDPGNMVRSKPHTGLGDFLTIFHAHSSRGKRV